MNCFAVSTDCLYLHPEILGKVAGVVELVDTLDLGSSAARCESSSLSACTKKKLFKFEELFLSLKYSDSYLNLDNRCSDVFKE